MKSPGVLATALAALIIAVAAWLGIDLDSLRGNSQSPDAPSAQTTPAPSKPSPTAKPAAKPPAGRPVPKGDFDYYVLSLSWSPSYCETEGGERDRLQCGTRPFGFIVHGLWPQNEQGYPEDCPTDTPRVPDQLIDEMLDIMPSRGLIGHEWRSHGACTGMSQEDYFAAVRRGWESVTLPARFQNADTKANMAPKDIVAEFIRANPELRPDGIVVTCDGQRLDEVRICIDQSFRFQACGAQMRRSQCRRDRIDIPPAGGEEHR